MKKLTEFLGSLTELLIAAAGVAALAFMCMCLIAPVVMVVGQILYVLWSSR